MCHRRSGRFSRQAALRRGCGGGLPFARLKQRLRDQIQRAHAGDNPQELADITDAAPPQPDDRSLGSGAGDVHILPAAADPDGAARGEVVAVEGAQERGLARAGRPVQGDALAASTEKLIPERASIATPPCWCSTKVLLRFRTSMMGVFMAYPCRMEETRSCV